MILYFYTGSVYILTTSSTSESGGLRSSMSDGGDGHGVDTYPKSSANIVSSASIEGGSGNGFGEGGGGSDIRNSSGGVDIYTSSRCSDVVLTDGAATCSSELVALAVYTVF